MKEERSYQELDIHKMQFDDNGVKEFFWPVSYEERENFCNSVLSAYTNLIRKYDSDELLSYKILSKYFITEALAVFNTDLLRERFTLQSCVLNPKNEWRLWSALLKQEMPKNPNFLERMRLGPNAGKRKSRTNILRKIKKALSLVSIHNKELSVGNLLLKPITKNVLQHDIIATERTGLIQKHAKNVSNNVVFCRSEKWFKSINQDEIQNEIHRANEQFEIDLINSIKELYIVRGIKIQNPSLSYLENVLQTGSSCIRIHFRRLLEGPPERIPRQIWTGTGGQLWDTLLRCAVLSVHSGYVVGHDHGAGLAHVDNPVMGMMEFWGCSEFICLNKNQATEMSQKAKEWHFFDSELPVISGLDVGEQKESKIIKYKKFDEEKFKIKTIIFLVSVYGGERVWMGPCSPDIVNVDWQIKLVKKLKSWGYDVIVKIHPETPVMPPDILQELGAEIRSDPLETMMQEGDLILFDCLYTSVFRSVLSSNIPMVLIDFYNHPWRNKAKKIIKNRIGFLEGGFDSTNQKYLDWDKLKDAIEEAPLKNNNTEFFDYYYA